MPDLLALGLLGLATLGFYWRVLLAGEWMPAGGGDLASFLYPTYEFAAQVFQSGHVPLWNPFLYGGMPFAADIQASLFYPINLFVFLIAPQITYRGMMGLAIFHTWLAGATAYLCFRCLLQRRGGGPSVPTECCAMTGQGNAQVAQTSEVWRRTLPPLAGALAYMFSDFFIVHFGNLNLIAQAAWLPLVFLFCHRALDERRLTFAVWGGTCLGIAATAGHMQPLLFIVLVLVVDAGYHMVVAWRDESRGPHPPTPSPSNGEGEASPPLHLVERGLGGEVRRVFPLAALALTLAIGAGLASVALVPAYEMASYTTRVDYDYAQATQYSLPPAQMIGFFVPSFFGRDPALHWGMWDRVEVGYLGVLPLVLVVLALLARRDRMTGFLALLAAFSLLVALGGYAVLHGWLCQVVPGLGSMRAPARFAFVTDFALAGLAALGLRELMGSTRAARTASGLILRAAPWVVGALVLFALPLSYCAVVTSQDKDAAIFARTSDAANGLVFFVGMLVAGLLLLCAAHHNRLRPAVAGVLATGLIFLDLASLGSAVDVGAADPTSAFDHPGIVSYLKADASLNRIDTRTGIWHLWQPDTPLLHGLSDVSGVVNPLVMADYDRFLNGIPDRTSRLYDFLNAKYVIAAKDVTLDWKKFAPVYDGDPALAVYLNRDALPRALVVHRALVVPDHEAAWAAVHGSSFDPATTVALEAGDAMDVAPGSQARIQFDVYGSNDLQLRVDMPADGYLVLSEVWYPGWQTWVDGEPAPVLRANYAFRAVRLSPGAHVVRMTFAPWSWTVGLALSVLTVAGVVVFGCVQVFRIRAARGSARMDKDL